MTQDEGVLQGRRPSYHNEGRLFDPVRRRNKANKVLAVLRDYVATSLDPLTCLEVGSSAGMMTQYFAQAFRLVVGIDVDQAAVQFAVRAHAARAKFSLADGARLPFPDGSFDIAICAQVYEHIGAPVGMADEIWRVLREKGVCFFSGPNKVSIMEEHTGLPLLHWLPRRLADEVVRRLKRGERFDENLMTYWRLRRLWHKFEIVDYSPALITDPVRFSLQDQVRAGSWASRVPAGVYRRLAFAIPNLNWVLVRRNEGQ